MKPLRMVMAALTSFVSPVIFAACAGISGHSGDQDPKLGLNYAVTWVDVPEKQEVVVRIESMSKRELCTGPGRWPNLSGHVGGSGLEITLLAGAEKYTYRDSNMEMCLFRECQNPMKFGSVLQSVLTYEGFGLPPELKSAPKALSFDPKPYWCRTRS
jgi:hypothetical protein